MKARYRSSLLGFAAGALALATAVGGGIREARGGDLVTLSGVTYHDATPVRVEPDGVVWQHAGGVAKVDFADSPAAVRETYHYDAVKAAAYHDARARSQQEASEQTRLVLQENEARQHARMLAQTSSSSSAVSVQASGSAAELVFRRAASPAASAATRALAEQMAADQAKQAAAFADSTGIGNAKVWSLAPRLGTRHPVISTDAPNTEEYKASIHHSPGGFTPYGTKDPSLDTTQDEFYRPLYLTRSYFEDIDRASAFARGVPLKQ